MTSRIDLAAIWQHAGHGGASGTGEIARARQAAAVASPVRRRQSRVARAGRQGGLAAALEQEAPALGVPGVVVRAIGDAAGCAPRLRLDCPGDRRPAFLRRALHERNGPGLRVRLRRAQPRPWSATRLGAIGSRQRHRAVGQPRVCLSIHGTAPGGCIHQRWLASPELAPPLEATIAPGHVPGVFVSALGAAALYDKVDKLRISYDKVDNSGFYTTKSTSVALP